MSRNVSTLPFRIDEMQIADIPYVMAIERRVFPMAWTGGIYRRELTANPWSHYIVLRSLGHGLPPLLAYGGVWQIADAAHIPTIATHPDFMNRRLGSYILVHLLLKGVSLGCSEGTLEVRISNLNAQALYHRFGFEIEGRRSAYYSDNKEDALIMTRPILDEATLLAELAQAENDALQRWSQPLTVNDLAERRIYFNDPEREM